MMDVRFLPDNEAGWEDLDQLEETKIFVDNTIRGFKYGTGRIPTIRRFDSVIRSNGIMVAVAECWPGLIPKLCEHLWQSVGTGLSYLKDERYDLNFVNLRTGYFSVIKHHMLPQAQALNKSLTNFLNLKFMKVTRGEPPASFAAKLREGQKMVNIQFRKQVIGDEIVEVMFLMGIKEISGNMYSNVLDNLMLTSITTSKRSFDALISALQEKWNQLRHDSIFGRDSELIASFEDAIPEESLTNEVSSDGLEINEMILFAGDNLRPNSRALEKKKIEEQKLLTGPPVERKLNTPGPCFKFAKTGECKFGDRCKYSHKINKDSDAVLTLVDATNQHEDLLRLETKTLVEQIHMLKAGKKLYKTKFNNARKLIKAKNKQKPVTKFFEDVVEKEESVNVAKDSKVPESANYDSPSFSDSDDDSQ